MLKPVKRLFKGPCLARAIQKLGVGGVGPTGKSISVSVAVALRACEAACRRVSDNGSLGAGPKYWKFLGVLPAQPAGRPEQNIVFFRV